jgi:predicted aspartyl protease
MNSAVSAARFADLRRQFVGLLPLTMPFWFPPEKIFDPPDVKPGPFRLAGLDYVTSFDTTAISEAAGAEMFGLIGGDCLESRIVRIDSDGAKFSILPATAPPTPEWGGESECRERSRLFLVPVRIGDETVWCIIDTGSNGSLSLPKSVFEKAFGKGIHQYVDAIASGMESNRSAIAPQVELFGQTISNVTVDMDSMSDAYGLVGLGLLRRFVVTLDYPGKKLYARPGKSFTLGDRPESYGIDLVRRRGRVLVQFIDPGGAADHAGVHVGDEIVSVNDERVEKLKFLDEVWDGVSGPERVARLSVLRADKRLEFAFSPR